jgi:hypothetical protein
MQEIRNNKKKLVCCADSVKKIVEIVVQGQITTIQFMPNGTIQVRHTTI